MRMTKIAIVLAACFECLSAQRTWIVNNGGPGDFTDIPPAVAAASPGDTICVLGFTFLYNSTSTNKGLTMITVGGTWSKGLFTNS